MSDPIVYQSASARFGLPFLFAGQAQKELFVNEAFARLDLLLHPAIEGELAAPPAEPGDGLAWLIGDAASGAWQGHDGAIAGYSGGDWIFLVPIPGLRVWDRTHAQTLLHDGNGWRRLDPPPAPSGGTTIDTEARVAIINLIASLREAGIFSGG
jgi:hypothetical protein